MDDSTIEVLSAHSRWYYSTNRSPYLHWKLHHWVPIQLHSWWWYRHLREGILLQFLQSPWFNSNRRGDGRVLAVVPALFLHECFRHGRECATRIFFLSKPQQKMKVWKVFHLLFSTVSLCRNVDRFVKWRSLKKQSIEDQSVSNSIFRKQIQIILQLFLNRDLDCSVVFYRPTIVKHLSLINFFMIVSYC